ncbi:MAG: hypothetical protein Q9181_003071 [Wetmoreana brouardii]
METLVVNGENINATGYGGKTALQICCGNCSLQETVTYLLERGADPNIQDETGNTTLHRAASTLPAPLLTRLLLAAGASAAIRNFKGQTPMLAAARDGCSVENLKLLVDVSDPTQLDWDTLLYKACAFGFLAMLEYLLSKGANPNTKVREDYCALFLAMERNMDAEEAVDLLFRHGARADFATRSGQTALHYMARYCNRTKSCDLISTIIEHGANIEALRDQKVEGKGGSVLYTPLWEACAQEEETLFSSAVIEKLLSLGANPYIEINPGRKILRS